MLHNIPSGLGVAEMVATSGFGAESWEESGRVSGLDFGAQLLQRFYTVEKVSIGSCAPHMLIYKPVVCAPASESLRAIFIKLAATLIKWKYIIFLFNNPHLKSRAAAMWPKKIKLHNLKRCLLISLHDCHMQRVKVQKNGMTIYLYAVKPTDEQFVMEDVWTRLQQLANEKGSIF